MALGLSGYAVQVTYFVGDELFIARAFNYTSKDFLCRLINRVFKRIHNMMVVQQEFQLLYNH